MRTFQLLAPAKVNLTLQVLGRRPDGFHELSSLFVPVALYDRLRVRVGGRRIVVRVPGHPELSGPSNLCAKAAEAFARETGLPAGVDVLLEKRIPVAAGLGGGSSDAAAVLRCLSRAHGLRVSDPRVRAAALSVGSDVPFFLRSRPALARGRGEELSPAPALPPLWLVIARPPFGISAAEAYRLLAARRKGRRFAEVTLPGRFGDAGAVAAALRNDLEAPVAARYPELARLRRALLAAGALGARMSGSGSCLFGVVPSAGAARRCAGGLVAPGVKLLVAQTLRRPPPVRET